MGSMKHLDFGARARTARPSLERRGDDPQEHSAEVMVMFVEVELADSSEFAPRRSCRLEEEGRYIASVRNAASMHTLLRSR